MAVAKTTKKTTTTAQVEEQSTVAQEESVTISKSDFEAFMKELKELKAKVETQAVTQSQTTGNDRFYNYLEVEVPVVSMCQGELILQHKEKDKEQFILSIILDRLWIFPMGI